MALLRQKIEFPEAAVLERKVGFGGRVVHCPETRVFIHAFHRLLSGLHALVFPMPDGHFGLLGIRAFLFRRVGWIEFGNGFLKIGNRLNGGIRLDFFKRQQFCLSERILVKLLLGLSFLCYYQGMNAVEDAR